MPRTCDNTGHNDDQEEKIPDVTEPEIPAGDYFIRFDTETIASNDGNGGKWIVKAGRDEDMNACFLGRVLVEPQIENGYYYYGTTGNKVTEYQNELFKVVQIDELTFEIEILGFPETGQKRYNASLMFFPEDENSKYLFGEVFLTIE
ncbi:MAG: hypothetical protein NC308_07575 [Clostridium sp.]|nr:hypothetical protein [Bacteroides sp.]MCM1198733.1 hypothetical protein [Clostridium sp.]